MATGRFGKNGEIMCFGLQLQKHPNEVVRQDIAFRSADFCPFQMSAGPAQQIIRGIEKAQMEHFQRQEPDKYLDPKPLKMGSTSICWEASHAGTRNDNIPAPRDPAKTSCARGS